MARELEEVGMEPWIPHPRPCVPDLQGTLEEGALQVIKHFQTLEGCYLHRDFRLGALNKSGCEVF